MCENSDSAKMALAIFNSLDFDKAPAPIYFTYGNVLYGRIIFQDDDMSSPTVRFIAVTDLDTDALAHTADSLAWLIVQEISNNDPCDSTVRQRFGHMDFHDDIPHKSNNFICIDATIHDYFS